MLSIRSSALVLALSLAAAPLAAQGGTATGICGDGTPTYAKSKSGACSNHGGVKEWRAPAAAAPAPSAAKAAPAPTTSAPPKVSASTAGATGRCGDGTTTSAKSKSGACSNHGGVKEWFGDAPAAAKPAPAPARQPAPTAAAPRANTSANGATAQCNDGTYSQSQHRSGTCSSHGGVKQWLKDVPPR